MKVLKIQHRSFEVSQVFDGTEISFEDWQAASFLPSANSTLVLPNSALLQGLEADFSVFDTIILEFPSFKDGRAYSQARRLREQFGFKGEIRARGDFGRDQILFMLRAGISAFEAEDENVVAFEAALREFSLFYQTCADAAVPVWHLRAHRAVAAA